MSNREKKPIHEQPKLCDHILSKVADCSVPLRIGASSIPAAGTGLFVLQDVRAGSDIFRSQPLLVVCEANTNGVCDYCLVNNNATISPEGHFFVNQAERDEIAVSACTGCNIVTYCSKECQKKAWESYHKYECRVLEELSELSKTMGSLPHALSRLLLWIKKQVISKEDLEVVINLETHYEKHNERWRVNHGDSEDSIMDDTLAIAHCVNQAVRATVDLTTTRKLFSMLMTNAGGVDPPDYEVQIGTFLDLLVSIINHCCDPNAHVFFEGRELRCRALKDIPAGTEITVNYVPTPRKDVLLRRNLLKEYMYIVCSCHKCKSEMAEHVEATTERNNSLAKLRDAQLKLEKLCVDASKAFTSSRVVKLCLDFQKQIANIADEGYPDGNWPAYLEPIPAIYRSLGSMYTALKFAIGMEFLLKGTLNLRYRSGPSWVRDLMDLVQRLTMMAEAGDKDIIWLAAVREKHVMERRHLRDLARGYLMIVALDAKDVFGMDCTYTQAVYNWTRHWYDHPNDARIESKEYRENYKASQDIVLEWAMVNTERGLPLPSPERVEGLMRDIAAVKAKNIPKVDWSVRMEIKGKQTAGGDDDRDAEVAEREKASLIIDEETVQIGTKDAAIDKVVDAVKGAKLAGDGVDGK